MYILYHTYTGTHAHTHKTAHTRKVYDLLGPSATKHLKDKVALSIKENAEKDFDVFGASEIPIADVSVVETCSDLRIV